ncbi:MAG TPA: DNA polymerase I, partial [Elusimicrobia bacterium]|nr:DNA polymerase I [Elusimicrobiota bacterium]
HALPPLTNSKGEEVGAVYGFIRMLNKIIRQRLDYLIVCFDYPAPTFRHREFIEYKATRKEIEPGLVGQIPLAKEIVDALNITSVEKESYEAHDLIATLAKKFSSLEEIIIVTGDKDVLQLVNDKVFVLNEPKDIFYTKEKVKEKYGVEPEKLIDIFGLSGDVTDNIPGVIGIGEKTALKLIQEYGSIENLYDNLDKLSGKLKENLQKGRENAFLSKKLVTLNKDVPLDTTFRLEDCRTPQELPGNHLKREKLITLLKRLEFISLVSEFLPTGIEKNVNCQTILGKNDFEKFILNLGQCSAFSFDLETTNLNPLLAKIVGLSFSFKPEWAFYIPVGHNYLGCPEQLSKCDVLRELKPILENDKIAKYGQNIKYDYLVLSKENIKIKNIIFDTMIASYLLNPSRQNHNLGDIVLEYLGEKMIPIEELIGKGAKQKTMDKIDIEQVKKYSCADAETVFRLVEILKPLLEEKKLDSLFYNVEFPLLFVLSEMENNGIRIDKEYFRNLSNEFAQEMEKLEKKVYQITGQEFNLNSPKQLSFILFEKFHLPVIRRTKTGISTDEEVLKTLSSTHELPSLILEYRELQKLKSTYVDGLIALVNPETGRLHTSFNQTVTATGRLSSSDPNLQNIPIRTELGKKIRRGFVPEEGWLFLSADYSQIDLRVLAHLSGDKILIEAFKKGEDVHNATACEIFGIPAEKISPELRRIAKTINLSIIYGMSAFGLSQQLGISQKEAEKYIQNYFNKYSGVKIWIEKTLEEARKKGYVSTLLNRIRYLPEINSKNGQMRSFAERAAMNTPVQGSAADIIKVAMINISRKLQVAGYRSKMLVQVHDELLFECPEEEIGEMKKLVTEEMENAIKLNIPLVAEIKTGLNWSDL